MRDILAIVRDEDGITLEVRGRSTAAVMRLLIDARFALVALDDIDGRSDSPKAQDPEPKT